VRRTNSETFPKGSLPVLEDSDIRIKVAIPARSFPTRQRNRIQSHAMLLAQRERGCWKGTTIYWQWEMLVSTDTTGPIDQPERRSWRSCAQQKIPFTALETPTSDAVLALESTGSYVLSLGTHGDYREDEVPRKGGEGPSLALRLYGIPSPSVLQRRKVRLQTSSTVVAPLLLTIPLGYDSDTNLPGSDVLGHFNFASLVTTLPVKICLSNDWKMGVVLIWPWRFQHRNQGATLVIFPLVQTVHAYSNWVRTYTLENIDTATDSGSLSLRSLLWKVECIPFINEQSCGDPYQLATHVLDTPGYLHFFDESIGFLMTWVSDSANEHDQLSPISPSPFSQAPKTKNIVSRSHSTSEWKEKFSDPRTGASMPKPKNLRRTDKGGISIRFTAHLRVYNLLEDLLLRRPNLVSNVPDRKLHYAIVSVTDSGKTVELAMAFEVGNNRGAVAVVLRVDILTQSYVEVKWWKRTDIQSDSVSDSVADLSVWCKKLAAQLRMRQQRLGPYCVDPQHPPDWGPLCRNIFVGLEAQDGWNPDIWGPLTRKLESKSHKFNRNDLVGLSHAALYPDCDLVDNEAVISHLPVFSMRCTSASTELVYG
jgi:hypothetical protein